jgi:hypothetical protein
MRKLFFILFIFGIFISCSTYNTLKLDIPINHEEITIKNKNGEGVYQLYCKIDGKVNGYLEIEFSNGENLTQNTISESGIINFIYRGDWYVDEFIVKIISDDNVSGNIKIRYRFSTLNPLTIY